LSEQFLKLWERETGTNVEAALSKSLKTVPQAPRFQLDTCGSLPGSFFTGRQLAFDGSATDGISKEKRVHRLKELLPLQPGDAGWLINKFIEYQYPSGGLMDLGNPSVFINSPSIWTHVAS
jgi:hypothetical protein